MEPARPNLALLIDFENVGADPRLDIGGLLAAAGARGRPLIKRAYADWGRFAARKPELAALGIELIELPAHGKPRKNAADIRLVVDAVEIALSLPHIHGFVIATGDSDFTPLLVKLREHGKRVIIASVEATMSGLLAVHADELLRVAPLQPAAPTPAPEPKATPKAQTKPKTAPQPTPTQAAAAATKVPGTAMRLLHRALAMLAAKGNGAQSSRIKVTMRQIETGFDESRLGFKRFSDFLKAAVATDASLSLRMDPGCSDYVLSAKGRPPVAPESEAAAAMPATRVPRPGPRPRLEPEEAVLAPLSSALLANGAMSRSDLALALKERHFGADDGVSISGLYMRIGKLVKAGTLRQHSVDQHMILTLPEASAAADPEQGPRCGEGAAAASGQRVARG
jgi:hypothetical protein